MKKKLMALLKKKEDRKNELAKRNAQAETVEELRSIHSEIDGLNEEIVELRNMIDAATDEEEKEKRDDSLEKKEERSKTPVTSVVLGAYGVGGAKGQSQEKRSTDDQYDTSEYRSAFMSYVTKGEKSEALEFRADSVTGTGDIGAVIPSTILNKIVEKLRDYGRIYARVSKSSVKGGIQIPLSNVKPKATWVSAGNMSNKQKKEVKDHIIFSYHKLQCRVAVELVADTVAMPVFEQTLTDNIYEAMIVAIEESIINGTGIGQPLGIVNDPAIKEEQKVAISVEEMKKYETWTSLYRKVPRSYRNGTVLIMADSDYGSYIEGMVDENGQPVARVTYGIDGTQQEKLLGKEVVAVEDYLPSIDDAEAGEVIGIIVKLSDYMINSNMQMTFKRYFNEDTDESISKSTLIADGKLADRHGVLLITKKADFGE